MQDDDQGNIQPSPVFYKIDEDETSTVADATHENNLTDKAVILEQPGSPTDMIDMDITLNTGGITMEEETVIINRQGRRASIAIGHLNEPGDITAALPTLGDLAQADEEEEADSEAAGFPTEKYDEEFNVTASVPRLGELLEEEDDLVQEAKDSSYDYQEPIPEENHVDDDMDITIHEQEAKEKAPSQSRQTETTSPVRSPAQHRRLSINSQNSDLVSPSVSAGTRANGQQGKWGFVPGNDDTLDVDLKGHGRMIMGDTTYVRMYNEMTTAHTLMGKARGNRQEDTTIDSAAGNPIMVEGLDSTAEFNGQKQFADRTSESKREVSASAMDTVDPKSMENEIDTFDQATEEKEKAVPDWTAPAFVPPFAEENNGSAHPALYNSPDVTNSSINTMSTRRVSIAVESRRDSDSGLSQPKAANLEEGEETISKAPKDEDYHHQNSSNEGTPNETSEQHMDRTNAVNESDNGDLDDTGDLLADEELDQYAENPNNIFTQQQIREQKMVEANDRDSVIKNTAAHDENEPRTHGTKTISGDAPQGSEIGEIFMGDIMPTPLPGGFPANPVSARQMSMANNHQGVLSVKMTNSPPPSAMSARSMRQSGYSPNIWNSSNGKQNANRVQTHFQPHMAALPENSTSNVGTTPVSVQRADTPGTKIGGHALVPSGINSAGPLGRPGSFGHANSLPPPGSAIAARYPGSAVATGRLSQGYTPSTVPPITFQDFAKIVEIQFLDNLRRGASINYADLQPNPVPKNLTDAYSLLCITGPNVSELETAIHTLQTETARLRANASELEVMLGQTNPPIFRHVQTSTPEQLEAFRENIQLLKKVCRSKATAILKDVRCQMEDSKGRRLARAMEGLRGDLAQAEEFREHIKGVAEACAKFAFDTRQRLRVEAQHRVQEGERRRQLAASRAALADIRASNLSRRKRIAEVSKKLEEMKQEFEAVSEERKKLQANSKELRSSLSMAAKLVSSNQLSNSSPLPPREVLFKLRKVAALECSVGISFESASTETVNFKMGPWFRLKISPSPDGVCGVLELPALNMESSSIKETLINLISASEYTSLTDNLEGSNLSNSRTKELFVVDSVSLPAAVQGVVAMIQRCMELADELQGICTSCPSLMQVRVSSSSRNDAVAKPSSKHMQWNGVRIMFSDLNNGIRFEVILFPSETYPLGPLPHEIKVWYDGHGQLTEEAISNTIKSVAAGPGRLRAVCRALSCLVQNFPPLPVDSSATAFVSKFGNPLFGCTSTDGKTV